MESQKRNPEPFDLQMIRKRLHAHPELSGQENRTAAFIVDLIAHWQPGIDQILTGVGGTGVIAIINGRQSGKSVLFRAELDALPIAEINTFSHRSTASGIAHKCGHDGHMTLLLGVIHHYSRFRPDYGRLLFLFQPAEETGRGAEAVLRDIRFANLSIDYVFAIHNLPGLPLGVVALKPGAITAAVRSLIIRLYGKTAHAAEPENGINPAHVLGELLTHFKQLSEHDTQNPDFFLITVVHINVGERAYGVAAGYGEVHLTIRAWSNAWLENRIQSLLDGVSTITARNLLEVAFGWTDAFQANENNATAVSIVEKAATNRGLPLHPLEEPLKWGEDFGAFTSRYPGAFIGLGAGENVPALHNPDYDFPDELLPVGVGLFQSIAELSLS